MHAVDFIATKRDGKEHSQADIRSWFHGIVNKEIADYQLAAWLMAVYMNGLTDSELFAITEAMMHSGETLDLSRLPQPVVDKHSTGGVGDSTTMIVGPVVASLGVTFAKMSGRGLGHTGGTLDKLSAILGFSSDLSMAAFEEQVNRIGIAIAGQTDNLVPADGILYQLRDVTATVDSIPLIASSIMSKKLAMGATKIVLDVKTGRGAFMKDSERAIELAKLMVRIGEQAGRETVAWITAMDEPLGSCVGNAIEVREVIRVLRGEVTGPLLEVSRELAATEFRMASLASNREEALGLVDQQIQSGAALQKMRELLLAQGGDERVLDDPDTLMTARYSQPLRAVKTGTIGCIDAKITGLAAMELGAGREQKTDPIDLSAGLELMVRSGQTVQEGDLLAMLYANDETKLKQGIAQLEKAFAFAPADMHPLLIATVDAKGTHRLGDHQ